MTRMVPGRGSKTPGPFQRVSSAHVRGGRGGRVSDVGESERAAPIPTVSAYLTNWLNDTYCFSWKPRLWIPRLWILLIRSYSLAT